MSRPLAVLLLAAGLGKRTKVPYPKVLLPLCGRSLVGTVLDTIAELEPERTLVVVSHGKELVTKHLEGREVTLVDQGEPKGTGHAVQVAMQQLGSFEGDVLVLYGDAVLVTAETLKALCEVREGAAMSLLTAVPPDPTGLGRVLRDESGEIVAVREERDCSETEAVIDEINAGFYCFDSARLPDALAAMTADNAQGEYYITDSIEYFCGRGERVAAVQTEDADEVAAVNSLDDLVDFIVGRICDQLGIENNCITRWGSH